MGPTNNCKHRVDISSPLLPPIFPHTSGPFALRSFGDDDDDKQATNTTLLAMSRTPIPAVARRKLSQVAAVQSAYTSSAQHSLPAETRPEVGRRDGRKGNASSAAEVKT